MHTFIAVLISVFSHSCVYFLCRVVASLSIGTAFAFVTALIISITMLPSATITTFKLRAGLVPFADYAKVRTMRSAPDLVAPLRGMMFWGVLIASIIMGVSICLTIFLLLWQVCTRRLSFVDTYLSARVSRASSHKMCPGHCSSGSKHRGIDFR
jgi:hypothetical protein